MRYAACCTLICGAIICLACASQSAETDPPAIVSFGNGLLQWTDLTNGAYRIEWASSLNEPWQTSYTSLECVVQGSTNIYTAKVPMFYRVVRIEKPVDNRQSATMLLDPGTRTQTPSGDSGGPVLWASIDGTVFELAILENGRVLNLKSSFSLGLGEETTLSARVTPPVQGRYEWEVQGDALRLARPSSATVTVKAIKTGFSSIRFRFYPAGTRR